MAVSCQQRSARMGFVQDHGGEHAPASPSLCSVSFLIPGFLSWSPSLSSHSNFPTCELFILHPAAPPSPWCSLCSTPAHRASGLTLVTRSVPLSLPLLARLLVLRYLPHDLPSLCRCLFPLPLMLARPSPCRLGTRQGNAERPGEKDAMSSIRALRTTLATSSKTWWQWGKTCGPEPDPTHRDDGSTVCLVCEGSWKGEECLKQVKP